MKTLMLVTSGLGRFNPERETEQGKVESMPRASLFPRTLNADQLGENFLLSVPRGLRSLYRLLPRVVAQVLEAYRVRSAYDAIISWSERRALLLALILKIRNSQKPHIALMYWLSKPKQAPLLKWTHSHIDKIVTWSSYQKNYAIHELHIPEKKIQYVPYGVDEEFWHPITTNQDMICAVGEEMRDYTTFIKAVEGLNIKCQIIADVIRIIGRMRSEQVRIQDLGPFPGNVSVGTASYEQLRAIYARSFFVVVPILPTDTSSGLTVILEAMAMGKAVITSRTLAQVDVIEPGKTGILVPVGDSHALNKAIQYLLSHPDVACQMGKAGRETIVKRHRLQDFAETVKHMVWTIVEEKSATMPAK